MSAVTASEIEFYLPGADKADIDAFWKEVSAQCEPKNIELFKTDKENGKDQYEVALKPAEPAKTASDTKKLKDIISQVASLQNIKADFSAKPYTDQPGSGLHIHTHLVNGQNKNAYYKNDGDMSIELQHSLGGLVAWLNPSMAVFAPHADSYKRFQAKSNAPLTVSWGANNRTVAIRLPDTEHDNKRIEHRVAGSDAEPERVIAVILAAIHYGLRNNCKPGAQIYGDASLPMYQLPLITASLEEAAQQMRDTPFIRDYFNVSDLLPTL